MPSDFAIRVMTRNAAANPALRVMKPRLAIVRLGAMDPVPAWADGHFSSVTRTANELSVVCVEDRVPDDVTAERKWLALEVAGPLDLGEVGILATIVEPLKLAGISIFAISTYDTDYILVRESQIEPAIRALRQAGYRLTEQ